MGRYAHGILVYGLPIEEGVELPWDGHDDIESWWRAVSGFESTKECPFTPEGEYKSGFLKTDPRVDAYFDEMIAWEKEHPMPVELVYHRDFDYPMTIIALPGTKKTATAGVVAKADMPICNSYPIIEFCGDHSIDCDTDAIGWYLASLFG